MFDKTLEFYEKCSVEELAHHLKSLGVTSVPKNQKKEHFTSVHGTTYSLNQCKYNFGNVNVDSKTFYKQVSNKQYGLGFGYNSPDLACGNAHFDDDYYNKYNKAV